MAHRRVPTHAEQGASQALALAGDLVGEVGGPLAAAGVASPGVVRPDGIDLAPNVPGWERLRLTEALPHPPDVVRSGFADDAALYGALAVARDTVPASL
ncbi:hypothetical protein [Micromonospora sp. NPDC049282]|uniref:hypothetical protein n=1 Tax=Micromonospora sp. NPDC049282 TaxID=3364269 RepID=UPI003712A848